MYPRLSDLFQDLFGFNFPIPIYSFGFMVAAGAMFGAWILQKELDRMYGSGLIGGVRMPESTKDKKGRKIVFNGAQGEFHIGVELNHSGGHHR